jgi:cell fate regulator YaaT (PSP1 superfamily)
METVKIRLRKPTRVFTFLSDGIELLRDEHCIVRSDRGLEFGTCVVPPEPCAPDEEKRVKMQVVRKASEHDQTMFSQLQHEEKKAWTICEEKINARQLPMKLVDVEYTFDKQKIVFYFTAEDRVDFRDLVRELARDLKTRIELRHIQVRDQARIVGGIGICGRELCCSTWLGEFKPISMKMAKNQNLSLNPQKISGQCGRLLCCLSYENDLYVERRKQERQQQRLAEQQGPLPPEAPVEIAEDPMPQLEPRPKAPSAQADRPQGDRARTDRPRGSSPQGDRPPRKRRRRGRRGKDGDAVGGGGGDPSSN